MTRYSAQQIAEALGVTKQAAIKRANRESWPYETATGRGGRRKLYLADGLPEPVRQALRRKAAADRVAELARAADEAASETRLAALQAEGEALGEQARAEAEAKRQARRKAKERLLAEFSALPDSPRKRRARAREWALTAGREYIRAHGLNKTAGIVAFCHAFRHGEITIPERFAEWLPHRHGRPHLDRATWLRWERQHHEKGPMGLVDGYGNRRGQSKIEQHAELKKIVLGSLIKYPHITGQKIKAYLGAAHPDLDIVSARGIDRYLARWKEENAQVWCYISNPDQWKSIYMPAFGSHSERVERLNQVWELDSTPGDWMLTDGRHSVIGVIDLYSRRLKLLVSKSSKASAVCQVQRRAMLDWGVPEIARTDNGKDYTSVQYEEVLSALEIVHEICIPFASEEKGTIERAFRTMSHGILDLLPGFIGHNVAERKVIEARKSFAQRIMQKDAVVEVALSSDELQQILDDWADHVYAHTPHSGDGMDGKTPFEKAQAWRGPVRRIDDERALDMLLAEVGGVRTITKKGIRYEGRIYIAPELAAHIGREAQIKLDEHDMGRLYVYVDGEFAAIAQCPELADIDRREWAAAAKSRQKKKLAELSQEYRRFQRELKDDIPAVVLQHRIEQSSKLAAFPQRSEPHRSAGLDAAAEAARASDSLATGPADTIDASQHATLVAEFQRQAEVVEIADDPMSIYRYWSRVRARQQAGEDLTPEEADGLAIYWDSSECRSMQSYFESFGLDPLEGQAG